MLDVGRCTIPSAPYPRPRLLTRALEPVVSPVRDAVHWLDAYTTPRPDTHGNLSKPSMFQSAFAGGSDGFYMFGLPGIVTGGASSALGILVQNQTHSQAIGVAAGAAIGAAMGVAVAALLGGSMGTVVAAVDGALIGAFETFRGHSQACTRDSGNASLLAAPFIPGPAKMAAGLGSMIGSGCASKPARAVVGGVAAAAMGAVLAAAHLSPVGVVTAAAVSGVAGAVGPFFGPRFSQFFRNLSEDAGRGLVHLGHHVGLVHGKVSERHSRALGAIPASFVKEGIRAFLYSDGSIPALLIGGAKESIRQIHINYSQSKHPHPPAVAC